MLSAAKVNWLGDGCYVAVFDRAQVVCTDMGAYGIMRIGVHDHEGGKAADRFCQNAGCAAVQYAVDLV